jgi:acyl carrier protein
VPAPTPTGQSVSGGTPAEKPGLVQRILQAQPDAQPKIMEEYLLASVADIMGLDLDEIPRDTPLDRLGLDSMMAFELQQDFEENLGIEIGMERFMQDLTFCGLGGILLDALREASVEGNLDSTDSSAPTTQQRFVEGAL